MQYIDLTQQITVNTPIYPGDPPPQLDLNNTVTKDGFTSHTITLGTHVGTHIDAPAHMIDKGKNVCDFSVDRFIGNGVVIDARNVQTITEKLLTNVLINDNDIVLLCTGRDKLFSTSQYFTNYPEITVGFAQKLVDAKVKILGMDQASPDYSPFETHKLLLQNNILIIENLTNLEQLIHKTFTLHAFPMNIHTEAAPARVIATVESL